MERVREAPNLAVKTGGQRLGRANGLMVVNCQICPSTPTNKYGFSFQMISNYQWIISKCCMTQAVSGCTIQNQTKYFDKIMINYVCVYIYFFLHVYPFLIFKTYHFDNSLFGY